MVDETSNDNDVERASLRCADPHGQAAMLLIESLIHGLVARSVISVEDAVEIVDVAAEVDQQVGIELGDSPAHLRRSLTLLGTISSSLKSDTADG